MTSVHGIPVTGGSFPAQIWRLFMSSAIGQLEPESFPEPVDWPEWTTFERGQYARSFGYYSDDSDDSDYVAPAPETTAEATTAADTTPAPSPKPKPQPKPKPKPPVTPPPPTTEPPPPPPTTEPPPPPPTTEPPPPTTTEPPP